MGTCSKAQLAPQWKPPFCKGSTGITRCKESCLYLWSGQSLKNVVILYVLCIFTYVYHNPTYKYLWVASLPRYWHRCLVVLPLICSLHPLNYLIIAKRMLIISNYCAIGIYQYINWAMFSYEHAHFNVWTLMFTNQRLSFTRQERSVNNVPNLDKSWQ